MKRYGGTFADNAAGLQHAFDRTLALRRAGYKTRLSTTQFPVGKLPPFTLHEVVVTTEPYKPTRAERGCTL